MNRLIKRIRFVQLFCIGLLMTAYFDEKGVNAAHEAGKLQEIHQFTLTLDQSLDWNKFDKKRVVATGYTAGVESTGKDESHPAYGITYSGVKVRRDFYSTIAADTAIFPIGTILYIPGYGLGVVADTGSAIKGSRIDLYYDTVRDVYEQWGKRELDVYVVKKGEGKLNEEDLDHLNADETVEVFMQQVIDKGKS